MTCRIGVDTGAVARLIVKHRPAQGEHGSLGCVEVVNPKMQVKLHGRRRVRPGRRLMAGDRWNDRWKPAFSLSPTEYQSAFAWTTGHPVSRL